MKNYYQFINEIQSDKTTDLFINNKLTEDEYLNSLNEEFDLNQVITYCFSILKSSFNNLSKLGSKLFTIVKKVLRYLGGLCNKYKKTCMLITILLITLIVFATTALAVTANDPVRSTETINMALGLIDNLNYLDSQHAIEAKSYLLQMRDNIKEIDVNIFSQKAKNIGDAAISTIEKMKADSSTSSTLQNFLEQGKSMILDTFDTVDGIIRHIKITHK